MSKLLGIDYGTKRIGTAFADTEAAVATPGETIANNDKAIRKIAAICASRDIQTVVLGESKDLSGEDNPVMKQIRSFKKELENKADVPVVYIPEFFTSAQARRQPEAEKHVDGSAAAIILQSYLESQIHEDNNEDNRN